MRLVALPTSPYAARVLIQAYEKGFTLEVTYPESGVSIAQHAAANPFGRVPVLETSSGAIIESAAILEYLEDLHPKPSLRPTDPFALARMRSFMLATDHYLFPVIRQLRGALKEPDQVPASLASLKQVLDALRQLMSGNGYIVGGKFTLADCALVPGCFYLERFLSRLGQPSVFVDRPVLQDWWAKVTGHDSVTRVLDGLEQAFARPPK